tara:strand:- start:304 stop:513 length:210 start_codon:yes stop_codon:yes gene_type:complete
LFLLEEPLELLVLALLFLALELLLTLGLELLFLLTELFLTLGLELLETAFLEEEFPLLISDLFGVLDVV